MHLQRCTVMVSKTNFTRNSGDGGAGALALDNTSVKVADSLFLENDARGTGSSGSDLTAVTTVFKGNRASAEARHSRAAAPWHQGTPT